MGDDAPVTEQAGFMSDILESMGAAPEVSDEQGQEGEQESQADEGQVSFDSNSEQNLEQESVVEQVEQQVEGQESSTSVEDQLRAQLAQMALEIEQLRSGQSQQTPAAQQQQDSSQDQNQQQQQQTQQQTIAQQAYLTEEELDQVIDNPALILTAIQRAQQDTARQFTQNLPTIVNQIVQQQVAVQAAVTEFYDTNKDLRPHANYVQFIMREIETKHSDKTYKELFQMAADESRKRLGLNVQSSTKPQAQRQSGSKEKPAFAGTRQSGMLRPKGKDTNLFDPNAADMLPNFR